MCFHVCVKAKEREGKWECVCVNKDNSSRHNVQCMVVQQVVPHILSKLQPLLCYLRLRPLYLFLCLPYLITLAPPPFRSHCPSLQVLTQGCWWYLLSDSQCTYGFGWVDTMGGLTTYCGGSVAPETSMTKTQLANVRRILVCWKLWKKSFLWRNRKSQLQWLLTQQTKPKKGKWMNG